MIEVNEWYDGVFYRLKIPMPIEPGHIFTYVVRDDGDECVLVDAGLTRKELIDSLIRSILEIKNCKLTTLIITHAHVDHYSLAVELRKRFGVNIAMHKKDAEQLLKTLNPDLFINEFNELLKYYGVSNEEAGLFTSVVNGIVKRRMPGAFEPDITFNNEEEIIRNLRIIHTPGHSPGHVSIILDKHNIAFTGDLILPSITTHVGLTPINPGNPLMDYLNSLRKIAELKPKCVFPGHEGEVCNVESRIKELINHRVSRMCDIIHVLMSNPKSAYEVTRELKWMNNRDFASLDPMNKYLALTETAATIKYLESINIIESTNDHKYRVINPTCDVQSLVPKSLHSLVYS